MIEGINAGLCSVSVLAFASAAIFGASVARATVVTVADSKPITVGVSGGAILNGIDGYGAYDIYLLFHIVNPSSAQPAPFSLSVTETTAGARNGDTITSYFDVTPPKSVSFDLYACASDQCGWSGTTSSKPSAGKPLDQQTIVTWSGTPGQSTSWQQGSSAPASDEALSAGWYYVEVAGDVVKPDGAPLSLSYSISTVTGAPEPSNWVMLGLGFAGIGVVGLRGRRPGRSRRGFAV